MGKIIIQLLFLHTRLHAKERNTRDRLGQCQSLHFLYQKQVSGSDTPGCISNTLKACAKALIGERKSQGHRIT